MGFSVKEATVTNQAENNGNHRASNEGARVTLTPTHAPVQVYPMHPDKEDLATKEKKEEMGDRGELSQNPTIAGSKNPFLEGVARERVDTSVIIITRIKPKVAQAPKPSLRADGPSAKPAGEKKEASKEKPPVKKDESRNKDQIKTRKPRTHGGEKRYTGIITLLERNNQAQEAKERGAQQVVPSLSDLGKDTGISNQYLSRLERELATNGIITRPEPELVARSDQKRPAVDKVTAHFEQLLQERDPKDPPIKVNISQVAGELGVSRKAVRDAMQEQGRNIIPANRKGGLRPQVEMALIQWDKQVQTAIAEGARGVVPSLSELARNIGENGASIPYVHALANELAKKGAIQIPKNTTIFIPKAPSVPKGSHRR